MRAPDLFDDWKDNDLTLFSHPKRYGEFPVSEQEPFRGLPSRFWVRQQVGDTRRVHSTDRASFLEVRTQLQSYLRIFFSENTALIGVPDIIFQKDNVHHSGGSRMPSLTPAPLCTRIADLWP
jgi:hypothetical protein